jgi:NADH:ubiquinone oxidoreductase subunit E
MGGSELLLLEEQLPDELKALTEIEGSPCIGACKRAENGGAHSGQAPFAKINGEVLEQASAQKIIEYLRGVNA